jgi:RNA polymerase-binding transcription factor DksA
MKPWQRDELRRALQQRRDVLFDELRRDAQRARDERYTHLAGLVTDRGDESVADLLSDLGEAELTRDLAELREVEAARQRLAGGTYGVCTDCGAAIPYERLLFQPAAARCVDCQARHEKTYRR